MSILQKLWSSGKNKKENISTNKTPTYIDIIISLNVNKQIDFSLFIDDKIDSLPIDVIEYTKLCADFLNVVLSDSMKQDAVDVLKNQIKNQNNEIFIETIVEYINKKQKYSKSTTSKNTNFIKPSEVFARYTV